jgi:hypothetical protein
MCDSCDARAAKLRELIGQFELMAAAEPDALGARRLRRAVADLKASEPLGPACGCDSDVVWADEPVPVAV